MLVVKIELWPGGRESDAREIGRAAIVNVSSLAWVSDYIVLSRDDRGEGPQRMVGGHRRDDGFWRFISRAFAPGGPGRLPGRWQDAGQLIRSKAGLADPDTSSDGPGA